LIEKHCENIVEVLTNNAIDTAAGCSFDPTPSLPSSSSSLILPNQSDQSDIYRIEEESEIYRNSKGDIAD
jgi:hypothetical protein